MAQETQIIKVASPGRINLIGEHVDYNDGLVLPAAINKCIFLSLSPNGHPAEFSITSEDFGDTLRGDLNALNAGREGWHNYVVGVLAEIQKRTDGLRGFTCSLRSEIPVGAGVSSSAALECGLAFGLNELFDLGLKPWDLIHIGQDAEHNYVGTRCGIMDQFATVMGQAGHSMLLDCRSLEFEYVPARFGPYKLLLLNTNVSHSLASSAYNDRRKESAAALERIAGKFKLEPTYRALTPELVEKAKGLLTGIQYKRARFIVAEIQRVHEAVEALKMDRLEAFGELLYQSHQGLSKAYEVSCPELDFLVELAGNTTYVLGARMMGGGFGGCTLNLIPQESIDAFVRLASKAYKQRFGLDLSWFEATPSSGTRLL